MMKKLIIILFFIISNGCSKNAQIDSIESNQTALPTDLTTITSSTTISTTSTTTIPVNGEPVHSEELVIQSFESLLGYWTSYFNEEYYHFYYDGSDKIFEIGYWNGGISQSNTIIDIRNSYEGVISFEYENGTETMLVFENLGYLSFVNNDTKYYAGNDKDTAFSYHEDSKIEYSEGNGLMDFDQFAGFYENIDMPSTFIYFGYSDNNQPIFNYGLRDAGGILPGKVISINKIQENQYEFEVYYPNTYGGEGYGGNSEHIKTFTLTKHDGTLELISDFIHVDTYHYQQIEDLY